MENLVRLTKSISPASLKTIPAKVVEREDGIYLKKTDETGKTYTSLIERDKSLYYRAINTPPTPKEKSFFNMVYTTVKCNLKCPLCYEAKGDKKRVLSLNEIRNVVKKSKNQIYVLAGREATLRPDLPEIIKIISEQNFVSVATNGLKLADYDYLKTLYNAGLRHIFFSLNSVDDDQIDIKLNNQVVRHTKIKAIENIKRLGIPTIISMTVAKGINEGQIQKIFSICAENPEIFYELRMRSAAPIGKYINNESYCLSDLMKTTCSSLGFNYFNLKHEFRLIDGINKYLKIHPIKKRTCSSFFHVKINKDRTFEPLADILAHEGKSPWKKITFVLSGALPILINFLKNKFHKKKRPYALPGFVRISLRSWPTIYNIDLEEIVRKCTTSFVGDTDSKCFCLSNILNNHEPQIPSINDLKPAKELIKT